MGRAEYVIYEMPRKKPCSESPCTEKPYAVNPDTDTPVTENPAQLSTNRTSTETINKREKKEIQHRYGSYENVLLSDTEYSKLRQEFPRDYQMRVERLSEYMASTGRSYKNHLATIRSWAKREKPKYNPADYTFEEGDSIGGVVTCVVKNCPKGIGEPEFGKLHAMLGAAMLSINAAKGFEYGEGFSCATSRGSQQNDAFVAEGGNIHTSTNHSGGIQGGISNGEDIYFRTAFKPTATILQEQKTVDSTGNSAILQAHGRHDPCVVPRAVPIVEAMTAMVILDYIMLNKHTFL